MSTSSANECSSSRVQALPSRDSPLLQVSRLSEGRIKPSVMSRRGRLQASSMLWSGSWWGWLFWSPWAAVSIWSLQQTLHKYLLSEAHRWLNKWNWSVLLVDCYGLLVTPSLVLSRQGETRSLERKAPRGCTPEMGAVTHFLVNSFFLTKIMTMFTFKLFLCIEKPQLFLKC